MAGSSESAGSRISAASGAFPRPTWRETASSFSTSRRPPIFSPPVACSDPPRLLDPSTLSKLYDALRRLEAERAPVASTRLDVVCLEQLLAVHDEVLRAGGSDLALASRLAHGIGTVLRLPGAAIGVLEHGRYRILAVYGAGRELLVADDGVPIEDTTIAGVLASGRPAVVNTPMLGPFVRRLVLPFAGLRRGVVELLVGADATLSPDDVGLARVVAAMVGLALAAAPRAANHAPRP